MKESFVWKCLLRMFFQVKVREATSNDPWGPSSTMMSEIADLTYNVVAFTEIMQMIWKRLNDHGKNWRHVYKALVLLEYLIKTGSEKVRVQIPSYIFGQSQSSIGICLISGGTTMQGEHLRHPNLEGLPIFGRQQGSRHQR